MVLQKDRVQKFRGCLALCFGTDSPLLQTIVHQLDTCVSQQQLEVNDAAAGALKRAEVDGWHITLVTKAELATLNADAVAEALDTLTGSRVFPIGVGSGHPIAHGVYFTVCVWPKAQAFRMKHGLPIKDFHVSVSVENSHVVDKSIASLVSDLPSCLTRLSMDALEALTRQVLLEQDKQEQALQIATYLCTKYGAATTRGWLRLGDAAWQTERFKLAMLSYAQVLTRIVADPSFDETQVRQQQYCVAKMQECAEATEWGLLFTDSELDQVPLDLQPALLQQPWLQAVCQAVRDRTKTMSTLVYPSREKLWTVAQAGPSTFYKLPRFFRWVVPFQLAAMSTPRNGDDIRHLALPVGIHHIVTLTEEEPLPREWFAGLLSHVMRHTFLPVENYKVPTLAQIDLFMRICTEAVESGPVLVHCGGGKGRAGVMLACYLVAFGWRAPPSDLSLWMQPAMSADQAIESLRVLRPGSIETEIQEAIVRSYSSLLWKRQAVLPIPVDEPMISRPIVSGEPIDKTDLLVLCGLPGSGKTTFRRLVVKRTVAASTHMSPSDRPVRGGPAPWTGLSGDEHGRQGCERSIGLKGIQRAILDHVNGKAEDRKYFIKLASTWSTHATAVWFDFESELCIYRAQRRSDHPSLPPGRRVENAVQQHAREFEPPTLSEGFRGIVRVTSIEAAQELALLLAPPLPLLKFPRTPHAINLGAATDDDLIMADPFPQVTRRAVPSPSGAASTPCATSTTRIVITEKVDGANLGISLSPDGYKFVVQNRSHYIASSSHPQFRKLDTFLEAHRDTLMAILKQDKLFPDRFILYGEWLAAKHSIPYSNLNDWFYAFDLFDREEHRFWDRASFVALVTAANNQTASLSVADPILIVPELWSGTELPARDTLIQMAQQTRSHFYDGVIEGLYIKWEAPDHVQQRGKVVRADFICGNEHWTKNIIQFNTVVPQEPRYGS